MPMYTRARFTFARSTRSVLIALSLCGAGSLVAQTTSTTSPEMQEVSRLVRAGQYPQAIEKANGVLATRPKDALARFLKGVALTETGKTNDAIAIFQSITEDNPELPEPYNNLAVLYASKGQFEKARTALELAIQTHPSYSTAHENLGDVYAKLASQAYDRALQLDRGNSAVQGKLGLIKDLFSTQPKASQKPDAAKVASLAKPEPAPVVVAATPPVVAPSVPISAPVKAAEPTRVAALTPAVAPAATNVASTVTAVAPGTNIAMPKATGSSPSAVVTSLPGVAAPMAASGAPAPAAAKSVTQAGASESESVLNAVRKWATVWSNRDADGYISTYASSFKPEDGKSRKSWENERRDRVASPNYIKVELVEPVVVLASDGTAEVKFRQNYSSDRLSNHSVRKTLSMVKTQSGWQIARERNG